MTLRKKELVLTCKNKIENSISTIPIINGRVKINITDLEKEDIDYSINLLGEQSLSFTIDKEVLIIHRLINTPNADKLSKILALLLNDNIELKKRLHNIEQQLYVDEIL